jgi:ribosomal protein L37AE/L43A
MENYKIRYKNSKFSNEKVELDHKSFIHCEFENCIIVVERGETEVFGCSFKKCKLMLKGNAYTVGKIIKLFTGKRPLKVLDMEEPLFEKGKRPLQKSANSSAQKSIPVEE